MTREKATNGFMAIRTSTPAPPVAAPLPGTGAFHQTARRTSLVFAGNLAGTALGFVSNILIMRALGPAGFGVVIVAMTVLNVLWQLTGRGIDQALVRLAALYRRSDPDRADAVLGVVHRIKFILGGLLVLVGLLLAPLLTRFFLDAGSSVAPVMVAVLSSLAASLWGYVGAVLQARSEFGRYALLSLLNAGIRLAAVGGLMAAGSMTATLAVASLGLSYLAAALVGYAMCPPGARSLRGRGDLFGPIFSSSRWLVISSVLFLLYSRIDQLMLSRMSGPAIAGVYGAAATFIQLVDLLTASLLTVLLPRACEETNPGPLRTYAWTSLRVSGLLVVPMMLGFFLADPVIGRLLGPAYGQTPLLFKVILAGALFNVLTHPLQVVLHARGRTHRLLVLDVGLLLVSVLATYMAIRGYGVLGAAAVAVSLRVLGGLILLLLVGLELRGRAEVRSA